MFCAHKTLQEDCDACYKRACFRADMQIHQTMAILHFVVVILVSAVIAWLVGR